MKRILMKQLFLVWLMFLTGSAFGQIMVTGTVKDGESGRTLPGALRSGESDLVFAGRGETLRSALELAAPAYYAGSAGSYWVVVSPGVFRMGAEPGPDVLRPGAPQLRTYDGPDWDEVPVHEVRITRAYSMGVSRVTQGEFARFRPQHKEYVLSRGLKWDEKAPVTMVSWYDADAYCRWLSEKEGDIFRLPTEAEWEFAALSAERLGLKGIGDGIQEWCHDWWAPYSPDMVTDPLGPKKGEIRVARGGGKGPRRTETVDVEVDGVITKAQREVIPRITDRSGSVPDDRSANLSFRLVRGKLPDGTYRPEPPPPATDVNVSQVAVKWEKQKDPDKPYFIGGIPFIRGMDGSVASWSNMPENALSLPYFGRHHVPSIVYCENGDLLATSFTAPNDGSDQMAIIFSRLRRGSNIWDPPARFFIVPDRSNKGLLFNAGPGELHHYNMIKDNVLNAYSLIKRVSTDNGLTWTAARIVHPYPAIPSNLKTFTGTPRFISEIQPMRLSDGTLIIPSDAAEGGNEGGTVLWASHDHGESFQEITRFGWNHAEFAQPGGRAGWIAGIHASCVELNDGRLLAIGRHNNIDNRSPMSISADRGRTWIYKASPFPPILSGQRSVIVRLQEGPLLVLSYTDLNASYQQGVQQGIDITDDEGNVHKGFGAFSALSFDEGETWSHYKIIPLDHKNLLEGERGGYLAFVQTPDGIIHIVTSRHYYSLNLAWLKTPVKAAATE